MKRPAKKKPAARKDKSIWQVVFLQEHPAESASLFWVFSSLLLAFVVIISLSQIQSLDIWWHLKTGAWISQQHAIPKVDPFSFSAAGKLWISHEWLFGWLSYMVYQIGGVAALIWAKAGLIAVLFALAAWAARARGSLPSVIFVVLTVAYYISRGRFTERPELISLPLALGFIFFFISSDKKPWIILLAPCLELLWANIHGGTAVLGWGLSGAFLIDCAWRMRDPRIPARELIKNKRLLFPLLSFAGVILISLLNPHGFQAMFYGLLRAESPLNNKEFQSMAAMMSHGMDLSVILLYIPFAALLVLFIVLRPKDVRVYEWIAFLALLLLSIKFFRFRNFFILLSAPTLSMQLSRVKWLSRLHWRWSAMVGLLFMLAAANVARSSYTYRFGIGVHEGVLPVDAAKFIQENKLAGRMFNEYGIGGYLIWELSPERKVFIDGREDVYLESGVLDDYVRCFSSPSDWQNLVNKYGIDYAIVLYPEQSPTSPSRSLDKLAFARDEWGLVYFDDLVAMYIRRNGKNDLVLREKEIRMVQPLQLSSYLDGIIGDPEKLGEFSEEMNANFRDHPSSFRIHFTWGILAMKRGPQHFDQAIQEFEQVIDLDPEFTPAYVNLGSIYMYRGRYDEAKHLFQKALSMEKNSVAEEQLKKLRSMGR
jgi:hypothetical protein